MIDSVFLSNSVQNSKGGIEESTCVNIMAWLDQFGFKNSPPCLGDIQMKQVWALALSRTMNVGRVIVKEKLLINSVTFSALILWRLVKP